MQSLDEDLTYDYLHSSEDNLWSIMYLTGYLTKMKDELVKENIPAGMSALKIPNAEIKEIFQTTIMKWFDDSARAWNVAQRLHTGICHINGPTVHDEAQMPFGGCKASGYGRFGGRAGIAEFTELRWITIQTQPRELPF